MLSTWEFPQNCAKVHPFTDNTRDFVQFCNNGLTPQCNDCWTTPVLIGVDATFSCIVYYVQSGSPCRLFPPKADNFFQDWCSKQKKNKSSTSIILLIMNVVLLFTTHVEGRVYRRKIRTRKSRAGNPYLLKWTSSDNKNHSVVLC